MDFKKWFNIRNKLQIWNNESQMAKNKKNKLWNKSIQYLLAISFITSLNLYFDSKIKLAIFNLFHKIN